MRWVSTVGLLCAALLLLTQAAGQNADDEEKVVVLEGGRALCGKIVEDEEDAITLQMEGGRTITIERDRIQEILTKEQVRERFKERLAQTNTESADELYSLSKWCEKYGLQAERYQLLKKVLKLSPDHPRAKDELRILEGKLPEAKKKASVAGITVDPKLISKPKTSSPGKKRRGIFSRRRKHRRHSKESKFKPKGTKAAIKKALEWLIKHPIRVRYAPVGQVVANALAGLALTVSYTHLTLPTKA